MNEPVDQTSNLTPNGPTAVELSAFGSHTPTPGTEIKIKINTLLSIFFSVFVLGSAALAAEPKTNSHIVFMIGEDEYKTWETLPEFAKTDLEPRGFRVTVVHADPQDKNNFPGLVAAI